MWAPKSDVEHILEWYTSTFSWHSVSLRFVRVLSLFVIVESDFSKRCTHKTFTCVCTVFLLLASYVLVSVLSVSSKHSIMWRLLNYAIALYSIPNFVTSFLYFKTFFWKVYLSEICELLPFLRAQDIWPCAEGMERSYFIFEFPCITSL